MKAIVVATNGQFIYAGGFLLNMKDMGSWECEVCDYDERMGLSFEVAGKSSKLPLGFIDEIEKHKSVIYLKGETGTFEKAKAIATAACAILKTGGTGVKVETTGKSFTKQQWVDMVEDFEDGNLYKMFVLDTITQSDGTVFTCGMHNLGLKDTIISGEEFFDAMNLLSIFGYYQVIDLPTIFNNQTFTATLGSTKYRIIDEPNQPYINDELFGNPLGMWRLVRM